MNLSNATVIYHDFETYWADDYTLSKMPTQLYILDERFKAHGCCIAINDGPIKWFTTDLLQAVFTALVTKHPNAIWVAHNALFDMTILSERYGIRPRLIIDTAAMSRALVGPILRSHSLDNVSELLLGQRKTAGVMAKTKNIRDLSPALEAETAHYCANDVHLMREDLRIMAPHFPACELPVMTWVTEMMTQPRIMLDQEKLWEYHLDVVYRKENILEVLNKEHGIPVDRDILLSNPKFAELLTSLGVEPPTKLNKKGQTTWAFAKTDAGLKELLEHDDADIQALIAARLEVKSTIEETRSRTYATLANCNPVGVPLRYSGAIPTHRLAGCLVASTEIFCYNPLRGAARKKIVDVLPDDLVWDGEEFVPHEGVQFSGMREVVKHDGIEGTPEHRVFTASGGIRLEEAKRAGTPIMEGAEPPNWFMDSIR